MEKQVKPSLNISTIAILAVLLTATSASAVTLNLGGGDGGLVDLGNSSGGNGGAAATVDAGNGIISKGGLFNNDGTATAAVDLNPASNGGHDAVVDFGNTLGNARTNAIVDLGGTGGSGGNGDLLDLFGTTDPTVASVDFGGLDGATTSPDALGLFGTEVDTAAAGPNDANESLFGGSERDGTSSTDIIPITGLGGSTGLRVASIDSKAAACFTPTAEQIAKLAGRHAYTPATFSTWAGATGLKIVDVGLCNGAGARIGAAANIAQLQSFVNGNAVLKSSLQQRGHAPGDVIGIDKKGTTLVIYVS